MKTIVLGCHCDTCGFSVFKAFEAPNGPDGDSRIASEQADRDMRAHYHCVEARHGVELMDPHILESCRDRVGLCRHCAEYLRACQPKTNRHHPLLEFKRAHVPDLPESPAVLDLLEAVGQNFIPIDTYRQRLEENTEQLLIGSNRITELEQELAKVRRIKTEEVKAILDASDNRQASVDTRVADLTDRLGVKDAEIRELWGMLGEREQKIAALERDIVRKAARK